MTIKPEIYQENELFVYPNITFYQQAGIILIDNLKIGLIHEKWRLKSLLNSAHQKFNFIFYGHSHQPSLNTSLGTIIANPGNLAGLFYQASFAVLDTVKKELTLKIIAEL